MSQVALKQDKNQELHDAFAAFNEMSQQLASSYHALEQRVDCLNKELADAHSERLQELTEKERVANRLQSLLLYCLRRGRNCIKALQSLLL